MYKGNIFLTTDYRQRTTVGVSVGSQLKARSSKLTAQSSQLAAQLLSSFVVSLRSVKRVHKTLGYFRKKTLLWWIAAGYVCGGVYG